MRRLRSGSALKLLLIFNLADTLLTMLGIHLGVLRELNPVVLTLGFAVKTALVAMFAVVVEIVGYGRWLVVPTAAFGIVVTYTGVGIAIVYSSSLW